jgi:hypothetical protein
MPWWLQIENKSRQGKRQGQAAKRPDPPSSGNAMSAKTTPKNARRKKSKTTLPLVHAASMISMITQNLTNMIVVFTVSGAVLLGLLAVKHF